MFLNELTPNNKEKIVEANEMLRREHNIKIRPYGPKASFDKALQTVNESITKLKDSRKQFHKDPDYAKFLGVKHVIETMLAEGMYAESPAYKEMKSMIESSVRELMDSGYDLDEAVAECMNRFRRDDRFAHSDEHVLPIVLNAANQYYEQYALTEVDIDPLSMSEGLKAGLAKELGVKDDAILEQKVETMAKVSEKSKESVIAFLNSLAESADDECKTCRGSGSVKSDYSDDKQPCSKCKGVGKTNESKLVKGIRMFGQMIAEQNKFNRVRKQAVSENKVEFSFNGKTYPIEENKIVRLKQLREAVDIEQAEVIMAVRAIIDDLQDQVEKTGRVINEDIPAIVTQMKTEMGASTAQQFQSSIEGALQAHMESARTTKEALEAAVAQITGEGGMGDEMGLGDPMGDELGLGDPVDGGMDSIDMNEPSMAGPEDEPLGRAAVRPELTV